jgi:hypothetical protein
MIGPCAIGLRRFRADAGAVGGRGYEELHERISVNYASKTSIEAARTVPFPAGD